MTDGIWTKGPFEKKITTHDVYSVMANPREQIKPDHEAAVRQAIEAGRIALTAEEAQRRREQLLAEAPNESPETGLPSLAEMSGMKESETAELLDAIVRFVRRYVYLHDDQEAIVACGILHTYIYGKFEYTPYLRITAAEKACGKSKLLDVIGCLVNGPCKSDELTPAVIKRIVHAQHPTLLIDEIDSMFQKNKDMAAALSGVLNGGFKYGAVSRLCDGQSNEAKAFNIFCPKAFAGIGNQLPDTTISRSIRIEMRRKVSGEGVERFRERELGPMIKAFCAGIKGWMTVVSQKDALFGNEKTRIAPPSAAAPGSGNVRSGAGRESPWSRWTPYWQRPKV